MGGKDVAADAAAVAGAGGTAKGNDGMRAASEQRKNRKLTF